MVNSICAVRGKVENTCLFIFYKIIDPKTTVYGTIAVSPYDTCFNGIFIAKTIPKIKAPQYY